jgi:flagellar biogenesis protein FliO
MPAMCSLRRASAVAALVLACACATPALAQAAGEVVSPGTGASHSALPNTLPVRRDAEPAWGDTTWWPGWVGLAFVVALGGWFAWRRGTLVIRGKATRPRVEGSHAERVSSHALTPQASVHVVRWHGEELLVGCTPQQVTLLCRWPQPAQPEVAP